MVSAKEEPDLPIPPALDGLLKIHKRIVDPEVDSTNLPTGRAVCTRLLVAGLQAGSLIGKQGATIKSIQDDSHSTIRVLGGDHLPSFALLDDSVVEIKGEPTSVHKAVELIGGHLRKFLVDRSVIGIFETQMQMPNGQQSQDMLPSLSWGLSPSAFPTNILPSNVYGSNVSFMDHPPQQYDNYHPPVAMPSLDKLPRLGLPNYGHDASVGAHTTNYEPQQAMVAKVTQNMQIPLVYADRVIGVNGANISYIRRASGATVVIQESRAVPGEMTVEINGSASQIQAAQQLIQNSIAHTISSGQDATGPPGQAYNPYTNPPLVYASSTAIAPTNHTSMYGPGYSYGY